MQGDKNIIKFDGDHNSPRPQFYYDSITIFFYNVLRPPDAPIVVPEVLPEPHFYDDALDLDDVDEVCILSLPPAVCLFSKNNNSETERTIGNAFCWFQMGSF